MATVNTQQDDKNQVGGTQLSSGAGAGGSNPNTGVAQSPVKQNAEPQNQAGYTDVGSYLNANQGGAQNMGNQVASNLTNRYNQTKSGVQQSANDLINQVNQGYTKENADVVKAAAANPNAVAGNQDQLSAFQGQLNDTYSGPNTWGDYGTQKGNIASAQQYGNLNKTPGGTNVLAQELEGPTASQGVNQLDTLLLQGNPGAAQSIQTAADPYSGLNDFLTQQNTAATGAIGAGQTAAQNASQNALNAFTGQNGTLTNLNNTINQNTTAAQAAAKAQNDAVNSQINGSGVGIQGHGLNADVLKSLGLSAEQGQALQDAVSRANTSQYMTGHNFGAGSQTTNLNDLSGYLNQQDPNAAINAGNVATPEQYAQMSAIQKLLGDKTPQGSVINPALASLAGTAPTSLNQFNYQSALNDAVNAGTISRQQAQDTADQLTAQADAQHAASKQHGIGGAFRRALPIATKYLANPLTAVVPAIKTAQNAVQGKV